MTLALERPMSQVDSILANDIRHLIDNLDEKIYDIERDYQQVEGVEYILIDTRNYHYQLKLHDTNQIKGDNSGKIELLKQKYLHDGKLREELEVEIIMLPQFVCLITE
jgi:hypothetical protein